MDYYLFSIEYCYYCILEMVHPAYLIIVFSISESLTIGNHSEFINT